MLSGLLGQEFWQDTAEMGCLTRIMCGASVEKILCLNAKDWHHARHLYSQASHLMLDVAWNFSWGKVILYTHTHTHTHTHTSELDISTTIAFGKLILSKITFPTKTWVISSIVCSNKYIHCYISSLLWDHTSGSGTFLASSLCQHSSCGSGPFYTAWAPGTLFPFLFPLELGVLMAFYYCKSLNASVSFLCSWNLPKML